VLPAPPAAFVGREAERRRIGRLWRTCGLLLVDGPAGIGKTALVRRVVADRAKGAPVAAFTAGGDTGLLDGLESALALPEISTPDPDRALRIAAAIDRDESVVVVDDAHALEPRDEATLLGIAALLHRGRILATSRRPIDPGDLASSAVVVTLEPLGEPDAVALVRALLDRLGRRADPLDLARASSGSPLFCRLLAGGAADPSTLLEGLGEPARALLESLAVEEGAVPLAEAPILAELESRFLVERESDRVRLHDVVRDVVLSGLDPARRAALHRAAAAAHARAGRMGPRLRHLAAGGDALGLAAALEEGGDSLLMSQLRIGEFLDRLRQIEDAGVPLSARLRLRRALAYFYLGRGEEASAELAAAGETDERDFVLRAAVEVRALRERGAPADARAETFRRAFVRRGQGGDPADWGELILGYVWECMHHGTWPEATAVCRDVVGTPGLVDAITRARVLRILGDLLGEEGEPRAARPVLVLGESEAASLGSPSVLVFAHGTFAQHHARYGTLPDAMDRLALARAVPLPPLAVREQASRLLRASEVLARAGRLGEATDVLHECGALHPDLPLAIETSRLSALAAVASEAGDLETARVAARRLLQVPRPRHYGVEAPLALARLDLAEARSGRAVRRARIAWESARRAGLRWRAAHATIVLGEALARADRTEEARAVGAIAVSEAEDMRSSALEARARLALGKTLLVEGRVPAAAHELDRAIRVARAARTEAVLARATVLAGFADLALGEETRAAAKLRVAKSSRRRVRAPVLDEEIRLLALALRAARGSRSAKGALSKERHLPIAIGGPASHDLWMDASSRRVVVDGRREISLRDRPVLARLLKAILEKPNALHEKGDLFAGAWELPYRASRDATLYKAVARLAKLLDPSDPRRFLSWDAEGRLRLSAKRPEISGR
jgi:tetratricopeptide (TPR) repeat protein